MLCAGRKYPLLTKYLVNEAKCDINEQDENGQNSSFTMQSDLNQLRLLNFYSNMVH